MDLKEETKSLQEQLQLLNLKHEKLTVKSPIDGEITTWQVRETLIYRPVTKGQILLNVVEPQGDWVLDLQMPEDRPAGQLAVSPDVSVHGEG